MIFWISWLLAWLPLKIMFPTRIIGKKNFPNKGSAVVVCNHYSNWDVEVVQISFARRMFYLMKKEMMKNRFVGWLLKKYGGYPIDRNAPGGDLAATKFAIGTLKQGKIMCLFPEGTRNKTDSDELQALKSGSVLFAAKTNSPLVPMMLAKRPKPFHRNALIVGEPIKLEFETPGKPTKEELEAATQKLSETMKKLQEDYLASKKKSKKK